MNFIDLNAQQDRIRSELDAAIAAVLSHGQYVMGPEIKQFESELAAFSGAAHALGCANGTDAMILPMMTWGLGAGDAVFCPSFTFCATAEAIALVGATPVFVDIDRRTYNMCAESLSAAIDGVKAEGSLRPRAVIAVDLFGQTADYAAIDPIVRAHDLYLIADSAQGFGTTLEGHHPSHWADVTTTSFFPAKPLGCYGDGGAMITDDAELASLLNSTRLHGQGDDRYDNVRIGLNSRLDTLQAAILRPKLAIFADELKARQRIAARYNESLRQYVKAVPHLIAGATSSWAQYTIEVDEPDTLMAALRAQDIPSARYYPKPAHKQTAYKDFPVGAGGLRATEEASQHVISLPMHPYLSEADQDRIIAAIKAAVV